MSELGVINKLTKWIVLRNEQKYNQALEQMMKLTEVGTGGIAMQIRIMTNNHEEINAKILLRNNIVSLIVLGITVLTSILSVFGLFK